MDYEQLATSAVISAISKTNRLKAYVNSGDKEPSFDGSIYIYDNNNYSKRNLKRVAIQVKGKGVSTKVKNEIKYPISIIDLNNYMYNGGVVFFVVYVDKNNGSLRHIYYVSLLPFKIKKLLKDCKNTSSLKMKLKEFPTAKDQIEEIFMNFYANAQKQISFVNSDLKSIVELQKSGSLESISFSYISATGNKQPTEYPKLLNGKELYVYANTKGGASVPVDCLCDISNINMSSTNDITVSVDKVEYYDKIDKTITAEKIIYHIGSCITITTPNRSDEENDTFKAHIAINLKGTLKQRYKALKFIVAMSTAKYFEMNGVQLSLNLSQNDWDKMDKSNYPQILNGYQKAVDALEKLNVKKDIDLDKFTEEDYWKLNLIVDAIASNKPIKNLKDDLSHIINVRFGGLYLLLITEKQKDGTYRIWNYFEKKLNVSYMDENNKPVPASQYSLFKSENFNQIDNLNLKAVVNDFKSIEPHPLIIESGNMVMLEMLKAYDERKSEDLFAAIKEMQDWLSQNRKFLTDEVVTLNSLQIMKRERALTYDDKRTLMSIASNSESIDFRIGALILLDEFAEARKLLDQKESEDRELFMTYPITMFYKQSEDKANG